jgi:hypothetical protein
VFAPSVPLVSGLVALWRITAAVQIDRGSSGINIFLSQEKPRNISARLSGRSADRHTHGLNICFTFQPLSGDLLQWMQGIKRYRNQSGQAVSAVPGIVATLPTAPIRR